METFAGFPPGRVQQTPLPDLFFSQVLPEIDDLAELKLTLHVFWRLFRQSGEPRFLDRAALERDTVLLHSLRVPGRVPTDVLQEALERAVARGTLLALPVLIAGGEERTWYFPNTDRGRRAIARLQAGTLTVEDVAIPQAVEPRPMERPNIFALYEQNIGTLQPLIAEELREAEQTYPQQWIESAFRIAARRNVRTWRYIQAILERWASKGKDDGEDRRDTEEEQRRRLERQFREAME